MNPSAHLDATFAALADPTRRAILARLASGETSVKELCEPFELSQPAISKHLKVLERAGLIARSRDAQSRPARLQPEPLKEAAAWIDHYRKFWEESFDRLDAYLQRLQAANAFSPITDTPRPRKTAPSKEKSRGKTRH